MTTGYQMLLLTRHQRGVVGTGGGGCCECVCVSRRGGSPYAYAHSLHYCCCCGHRGFLQAFLQGISTQRWAIGRLAVIECGCRGGKGRRPPACPARERSDASLTGARRPEVESRLSLPSGKTKATSENKRPCTASSTSSRL